MLTRRGVRVRPISLIFGKLSPRPNFARQNRTQSSCAIHEMSQVVCFKPKRNARFRSLAMGILARLISCAKNNQISLPGAVTSDSPASSFTKYIIPQGAQYCRPMTCGAV